MTVVSCTLGPCPVVNCFQVKNGTEGFPIMMIPRRALAIRVLRAARCSDQRRGCSSLFATPNDGPWLLRTSAGRRAGRKPSRLILKSVDGPPARGPAWPVSGSRLVEGSCALPPSQQVCTQAGPTCRPRDGPVMSLLSPPPLADTTSTDDSEMRTTKIKLLCTLRLSLALKIDRYYYIKGQEARCVRH